jgi:hypothetical protein
MQDNSFEQTLPTLPSFCGLPDEIPADADVPTRNNLLFRYACITKLDYDCLPCVLELEPEVRAQLWDYILTNILKLIPWDVYAYDDFKSTLLEGVELAACWSRLPAHVWLNYAQETSCVFAKEPRTLSDEEKVICEQVVRNL